MNEENARQESFDLPALWAGLQDLEDGSIAPDSREALMDLLNESPAARMAYFEYFHQAAVLEMEAAKMSEEEQLAKIMTPMRVQSWWIPRVWAAAAVLMLAAVLGFLMVSKYLGENKTQIVDSREQDELEHMFAVASIGSEWEINKIPQIGATESVEVKAGDSIRVLSGTVKLEFTSGSQIIIQDASSVIFSELRKPLVEQGLLWIDTGATDDAFEVSTSELIVRDIGTRFGVRVGEDNRSEIHLHEGGVNVHSRESGIQLATLAADGKGQAVSADGNLKELPLEEDPFPSMHKLLSGRSAYTTAILSQNPISYVKFYGGVEGRYDNEIRDRRTAKSGPAVALYPSSVNEDSRFKGFGSDNQSLYLPANERSNWSTSVVAFLDGSAGISSQAGSATFWIKRKDEAEQNQVLWMTGKINPEKNTFTGDLIHTFITPTGQIGFSFNDGNRTLVLKSDQTISSGTWHHIGITWNPNSAGIYIDGQQSAYRDDMPNREEWVSVGNFVRFGKPNPEQIRNGVGSFHGWFDEFALWNRPLTPEGVAQQYKAAIGEESE